MICMGIAFAFLLTLVGTLLFKDKLPRDQGRAFAQDGMLSQGKPRGAGIIFVLVFAVCALIFGPKSPELRIYIGLIVVEMLTGYLDDASEKPWGEYLKGALDLAVAVATAVVYLIYNGSTIVIASLDLTVTLPVWLFGILTVILVWAAINVTNCSDGVDGLSASMVLVSLGTFYGISRFLNHGSDFSGLILMFMACLVAYLWFNATPSLLLMGDAGSRAMGFMIALAALKCGAPLLFLPAAGMLIVDGGLGLVKVALLRFLKIRILKNTLTPIHDHVRKNKGWSNTQVVFRFAILQAELGFIALMLAYLGT